MITSEARDEVGDRRSEAGGRGSEVGDQKSEVGIGERRSVFKAEGLWFREHAAEQTPNFLTALQKFNKTLFIEISAVVCKVQPRLRLEIFAVGVGQL